MGDEALVAALRCEDEGALREFFLRFRPELLLAAGRLGVDPGERDALVDDCLADVAVHLITSSAPPPRSLPAYLARSLRNRVLNGAGPAPAPSGGSLTPARGPAEGAIAAGARSTPAERAARRTPRRCRPALAASGHRARGHRSARRTACSRSG